jgi:hypothetical protein
LTIDSFSPCGDERNCRLQGISAFADREAVGFGETSPELAPFVASVGGQFPSTPLGAAAGPRRSRVYAVVWTARDTTNAGSSITVCTPGADLGDRAVHVPAGVCSAATFDIDCS